MHRMAGGGRMGRMWQDGRRWVAGWAGGDRMAGGCRMGRMAGGGWQDGQAVTGWAGGGRMGRR